MFLFNLNFIRDIAMAQKLINSRMTAQTMAIAGFAAAATAASMTTKDAIVDPYYERIVNDPHYQTQPKH